MDYERISVADAVALMETANVAIADIRDSTSYAQSHLPGAVHVTNSNMLTFVYELQPTQPILVYCNHGNASRITAQCFADQLGMLRVYSLEGGYAAWQREVKMSQAV